MTRIAHLSDLHFGRTEPAQLDALAGILNQDEIDVVIVTGDLTQSGRKDEFHQCAEWFRGLRQHVISVPGNHDVPVRNLIRRFFVPWRRYAQITGLEEEPRVERERFVFKGLNSARRARPSLDWSTGTLSSRQLGDLRRSFSGVDDRLKLAGFHHPVLGFEEGGSAGRAVVAAADEATLTLAETRTDIVLTGHVHKARVIPLRERGWSMLLSQAGTAVSTRLRGEPASYNVLSIERPDRVRVSVHRWSETAFEKEAAHHFLRTPEGWEPDDHGR